MSSLGTFKSQTPRSREKKALNPKPQILGNETLSTKTPQKSEKFSGRARNGNVALSIGDIRRAATKSLSESSQKRRADQIDSWPDESPKKKLVGRSEKLPEKYEILSEFLNGLDTSIRLLRLRGLKPSFTNICPQIECLTDRRFTCGHLAQLKFVLPEVIEIKKVLVKDERTSCLKPDLHVTINVDALESDGKAKSEGGGSMHLRKTFRKRLADISKSHPEDYEIPEETLPQPFDIRKQDMQSDTGKLPFSSSPGDEVPESNLNTVCSVGERSTCASLYGQVPVTPTKGIDPIENDDRLPTQSDSIQSTPAKLASTPARLMADTPALHRPKRCYMSPDDNSTSSPNKLVRRPPRSRSLKFDTPVKNKNVEDEIPDMGGASIDTDSHDILPEDLLQSIREKERKAIEEQNPAISEAKRRRQMISSLPKLFNMIHFLLQSMNRSVITKEELVHKLIWTNFDIVDRKEVQEQLKLLLELVPDWISEKQLSSEADLIMIHINKMSDPESIRARLEEAK
ncbi:CDT1-like protein a, chloroplastic isoform X2 [Prunus persica]|uniref:CDT1-like protein a, chloroplastic isoform X2 n=1 Tax=Prunus persica TaxID=3760 RepID=UPI0009AB4D5D|nr:CDT1-like protein a, chloroplastic isoform X2 [Prunus persica]